VVTRRHVPESYDPTTSGTLDLAGATVGALGLAGTTYALIEGPARGATSTVILVAAVAGGLALTGFVAIERRSSHPMLPIDIFSSRQFTAANLVTLLVYAALGGTFFLLVLQLQIVLGYSALASGSALFPVTILMLLLSPRAGQLAVRIGPRLPMSLGPVIAGLGLLLMVRIEAGSGYAAVVAPAAIVFGLGLSLMVAPLTATVLAAADVRHAGIASGVNNAVARVGGLAAIAVLPLIAGLTGEAYQDPALFAAGFRTGILVTSGLCVAGGLLAFVTIRNETLQPRERPQLLHQDRHCAVDGTPLRPAEQASAAGAA
jgi:Na+/melibiose symporter-like transporter